MGFQLRTQNVDGRGWCFQRGDELRQCAPTAFGVALYGIHSGGRIAAQVTVAAHDHFADHALQPHALAVLRAVNTGHAIGLQFADFFRHDDAAATAEHLYVRTAALAQ